MDINEKRGESAGGNSFLSQLITTLEGAQLKLEQAYKKDRSEQVRTIKEFILKIQKKIAEELK